MKELQTLINKVPIQRRRFGSDVYDFDTIYGQSRVRKQKKSHKTGENTNLGL